ncbi:MAG TPA: nucleotidyltransferase family protein [Kiritimatiellia bacterium]|mgnify:FL=1|nr:nucleotidyltransferase family protein [Kiritimatiellia bacterium]
MSPPDPFKPPSPEMALLLRCAAPGAEAAEVPVLDWPRFLALATHHHLLPLVARRLNAIADAGARVPGEWLGYFQRQAERISAFNLRAAGILRRLQRLARERDLRLIPVKGPALAAWAYGDIALRQFEDLDLVVPREDLLRAVDMLEAEGYRLRELPVGVDRRRYLATGQDWSMERPGKPPHLDLKPVLISHALCGFESADWLLCASRPVATGDGGTLEAPGPEAMLLAVCVDGANEGWPKLSAVADVAALLANQAGADWAGLLADAGRLGQRRSVLTGAALAERLLACPLSAPLADALRRDPLSRRLAETAARSLAAGRLPRDDGWRAVRFAWRTRDDGRVRFRYLRRVLCVPGAADLAAFALPPPLDPLYACLRPVRLAWDALRGRSRRIPQPAEASSP